MSIQIIVYSIATGRVRRAVDPLPDVPPNAIQYLNQVSIVPGEARLVYTKSTTAPNDLNAWQTAVNSHTGLTPNTLLNDWYCGVDGSNNILWWNTADPLCDSVPGLTLVNAPWGANNSWTYNGTSFIAPVVGPKP